MRRYALILATANYDDSAFRPLPSVHADAWYLPQVLEDPAIGGFEQVQVVKDAPAGEMRAATVDFLNRRGPDELALLYISGHGVWSREIGQLYFIATSTTNGRLPETGVAAEFVNEQLEACPAGCKVAILDCCFSGAFVQGFRTRGESGPPPEALTSRGVYVITASDSRETAYEGTTFNGSVAPSIFTGAFLEGLRTGRADLAGDGQISVDELYRYVHDQVKTMSLPTAQTPTKSAQRVVGEIILARSPTGRRERPRELVPLPAPEPVQRLRTPIPSRAAGLSDLAALDLAQWQRLLSYWLDCVIQEAASEELLDVERDQGSFACWPGAEQVLTGAVDQVQVPDGLADFFANAARNHKTLFYGYPAVIRMESAARQKKRRRTLAPLFMQQLEVHQDADRWTVSPVGPVLPHLALVLLRLPSGEAEAFVSSFEPNWAADEVSQFVREVRQRLEELGLREIEPLQPDKLSVDLRLQPPATGARNVAVVFEAPEKSAATAGLVTDLRAIIQQLASIAGTALGTLSSAAASGAASGDSAMVAPFSANEAQEAVIRSAMTRRLTVATGPPGTGKSQLVANLVATAVAADQSVLVASTNNQAVDEVVQRCDSIMPGLILRTGRETERQREADALDELLAWRGDGIDPATSWHTHRLRTDDVSQVRSSLHSQAVLEAELASLVQQREARAQAAHLQAGQLPPALAAHDSLHRWLERARRANGSHLFGFWLRPRLAHRLGLADTSRETCRALQDFLEIEIAWRDRSARAGRFPDDAHLLHQVRFTQAKLTEASRSVVQARLIQQTSRGRQPIIRRLQAVRAGDSGWREFLAAHPYLRGYAVTTHSIRRFPPRPALFDLAIVDEASQCSIPAVVPVLFRAKRVLIIGDPMQLTHVTTMTANTEADCRTRAEIRAGWLEQRCLAYRRHSAFRAFDNAADHTLLLDEHYRCHPAIAEISNRLFYGSQLTILTDVSRLRRIDDKPVTWQPVLGVARQPRGGSWSNEAEAQRVSEVVRQLQARLPAEATIGVVTPYRAQRELISKMCHGTNARVGTVHTFQGGECDAMVLSIVGGREMPQSGLRWLQREPNLWNVAITRARSHLIVVGDLDFWRGRPGVIGALADLAESDEATIMRRSPSTGEGGRRAADMLQRQLEQAQPPVNYRRDAVQDGYWCDFLIDSSTEAVAVLLDYGHGEQEPARHLRLQLEQRDRLAATGARHAIRVPAWRALLDPERVVRELRNPLGTASKGANGRVTGDRFLTPIERARGKRGPPAQ
jgi:AAA domain-containing protein